jgi:hypothetical protein
MAMKGESNLDARQKSQNSTLTSSPVTPRRRFCNRCDVAAVVGFVRDLIEWNGGYTYVAMLGFVVPGSCSSVP